uniref:BHLH domain-containing protein n=1 Tax=Parascaris univalens TaxID=6257 RepID=A0A914ZZR4_PARUN
MSFTTRNFTKRNKKPSSFKRFPVCRRTVSFPSTSVRRTRIPVTLSREENAELEALAQLLPQQNRYPPNDPYFVLRAAAQYIDQLRTTIAARVRNGTLPADAISRTFELEVPASPRAKQKTKTRQT